MQIGKFASFLLKSVTVGLAAALVIFFIRPDLLGTDATVVEIRESSTPALRVGSAENSPASYAGAVGRAAPAVVNINTSKVVTQRNSAFFEDPAVQRFFGDAVAPRQRLENSLGSGVIVSPQGYILTNNHVIEGADQIEVALSDGRSTHAQIVGTDRETDLAVLKVDLNKLPSITLGSSDHLHVGDIVLAIGNPFAVGQTVTHGIVSATGRNRLGINTFENFIQTDAAINPGNSGGALVDSEGSLIGINTAIFSRTGGSQGIGFAIPVSLAKGVMEQIIEHGRAIRGWLGIEAQAITPALAESFGLDRPEGVLVAGVLRNGPGDQAGIKTGDIIKRIDGKPVNDTVTLMNTIAQVTPGASIKLLALRQGERVTLTAEVSERPAQPSP